MSLCGNRSPITGECILGCPGFGGCKMGDDDCRPRPVDFVPFSRPGEEAAWRKRQ